MHSYRILFVAVCGLWAASTPPAQAMGFCVTPSTLREQAARCEIILFGQLKEADHGPPDCGSTDLVIMKVIKSDPALDGCKMIRLPWHILIPDPKKPPCLIVFGDINDGKLDFFQGFLGKQALANYIAGLVAIDATDRIKLLRYCFDNLQHEESEITMDAFREFSKSVDMDIRLATQSQWENKLRLWLQNEKTPAEKLPLYAFLLANFGNQEDVALLRKLLDRLIKQGTDNLQDILKGYALLCPKAGWAYIQELLKNPDSSFSIRYSAFQATQYLYTRQTEPEREEEILTAIGYGLEQPDIADLSIESLRKWKCWKLTNQILAHSDKKGFEARIIQRSILRYALQCPDPQSAKYVAQIRKANPSQVEFYEEVFRSNKARSSNEQQ